MASDEVNAAVDEDAPACHLDVRAPICRSAVAFAICLYDSDLADVALFNYLFGPSDSRYETIVFLNASVSLPSSVCS